MVSETQLERSLTSTIDLFWEAVVQRCSVKKMLLQISQNLQENICTRVSFLIELQAQDCNFIKNEVLAQMFPVNFVQFLRTPFYIEHFWCLVLFFAKIVNGLALNISAKKLHRSRYPTRIFEFQKIQFTGSSIFALVTPYNLFN